MFDVINAGAKSSLPFSPAIVAGDFVFVSGQASVDAETGEIITDTFAGEMRRSFGHLEAILKAAGCTLGQVVSIRAYVENPDDLAEYNRIYREIFSSPYPTRTTITQVLGKLKFEVDCVAYKG